MDKNYLNLSFCIWGDENLNDTDISTSLGIKPRTIDNKGQLLDGISSLTASHKGLIFDAPVYDENPFADQLNYLLNILEPQIPVLRQYTEAYVCKFLCVVLLSNREESIPWIHFDKRYNAFITETNVKFDLKICFSPKDRMSIF